MNQKYFLRFYSSDVYKRSFLQVHINLAIYTFCYLQEFQKIGVLKNLLKFIEKYLCSSLFQ